MNSENNRPAPECVTPGDAGAGYLWRTGWVFALLLLMMALLYGVQGNAQEISTFGRSAIWWMVLHWSGVGGDLSHGWIIPIVSVFVVWRRRKELLAARKKVCMAGLAVAVLALLLLWTGVRVQQTRLSILSLVLILWGVPFYLYGKAVAGILLFPCAYLLFCIPMSFLDGFTVPLRILASTVSTFLLNALGIAAVQSGTAIHSAVANGFSVDVADPCSGLRSLLAMTALAAPYAYFTQKTLLKQWILFLCAVPLALAGNIVRILAIVGAAALTGKDRAMQFSHDCSGYVVFVVAVLLMIGLGSLLRTNLREIVRVWRRSDSGITSSSLP